MYNFLFCGDFLLMLEMLRADFAHNNRHHALTLAHYGFIKTKLDLFREN